jgi:hypothetical protein
VSHEPNLDFYRRRAKELLGQAQAGDSSALSRFEKHYPEFRGGSQPPADLALSQAQLVIARENGFPNWPRLKAYIEALERSRQQSPEDRLQSIIRARDLDALCTFIAANPDSPNFRIEPVGDTPLHLATGWLDGTKCYSGPARISTPSHASLGSHLYAARSDTATPTPGTPFSSFGRARIQTLRAHQGSPRCNLPHMRVRTP